MNRADEERILHVKYLGNSGYTFPALHRISRDKRPCQWNTSTYTSFSSNWHAHQQQYKVSDGRPPIFSSFFSSFLSKQGGYKALRIPPLEDIEFLDDIQIKIQNMRLKSLTNDQTVPRYRYFNFYKPHKVDGKGFSSQMPTLKIVPLDQKSKCRTCAEECQMPFNLG